MIKYIFSLNLNLIKGYNFMGLFQLMKIQNKSKQQHSLSTIQVPREPVKEVKNLPSKITYQDLIGLSWTLFEEDTND